MSANACPRVAVATYRMAIWMKPVPKGQMLRSRYLRDTEGSHGGGEGSGSDDD